MTHISDQPNGSASDTEWTAWILTSLDPGVEVVQAIASIADGTPTLVEAFGEIRDAVVRETTASGARRERILDGAWDMTSLRGFAGRGESALFVSLTRAGAVGTETAGGILARATATRVLVHRAVSRPHRIENIPVAAPAPVASTPIITPPPVITPPPAPPPPAATPATPTPALGVPATAAMQATPLPRRPAVRDDSPELYPEEGDEVTHFAFGRCTVVFSDGERIRLQQGPDGRVREVALSMLRIQSPTVQSDGKKHWELARKN